MMSEEFKDYYNQILEDVFVQTNNIPYAETLVKRNYFRIKTGFYEDENPKKVANDLIFQINETVNNTKKLLSEGLITESKKTDFAVRSIVRTIVDLIKKESLGTNYLPEDLKIKNKYGEDIIEYDFTGIPYFSIEFDFQLDRNIDSEYSLNSHFSNEDDVIEMKLIINPEYYPQCMYDVIADLNDNVVHEMEHLFQNNMMRPSHEMDLYTDKNRPKGSDYYKQQHEIPAQIKGFKRVKKLRNEPIEKVIKDWFHRNKNNHNLNDYDIDELTKFLSIKYRDYYSQ